MAINPPTHPLRCVLLGIVLALPWVARAEDGAPGRESVPTSFVLGFERLQLPQGESMGLVGASLLFEVGGAWGLGPAIYGAATGERGGFFVGGVELQHRWRLGNGLALAAGLYAGGGGGAAAPVGSGLMLRPALTLLQDLGPNAQIAASWSLVRFPDGQINSRQLGLALAWRGSFDHLTGADGAKASAAARPATGLGFERIAATVTRYRFGDGSGRRIGLAGVRAEHRPGSDGLNWGLEAAAAAQGDAAGYMEVLGTASLSTAPLPAVPWRIGVRLGAGLGGGGAVPTGGGGLVKAAATTELRLAPGWTLGAEAGLLRARGTLRARSAQVWLGLDLEPGPDSPPESRRSIVRTEWVAVLQHHSGESRADGTRRALDTIGLKLNRALGEYAYLSGQAHSAYAGRAGAYSVGLLGVGVASSARAPWRVGAELLLGAAGGGGVATGGGGLAQGLLWCGWSPSPRSDWRLGAGRTRSLHGGTGSPLLELSWSRSFGMAGT